MPHVKSTRWFSVFLFVFSVVFFSGCSLINRKPNISGLQITTEGISTKVLLNGASVGSTPYSDQNLKPGSYTVKLVPEDTQLASYETSVTLYQGALTVMNWNLGKTPETSGGVIYEMEPLKKKSNAYLSIASIPDGAIVKVDEVSQGFTPVLLKTMTPGSHRFSVTLPSFKDRDETVNIVEGFQMNVTVKLAKQKPISPSIDSQQMATESATATASSKTATSSATVSSRSRQEEASASARSSAAKTLTIKETGTGWLRVRSTASASGEELAKVDVGETFPYFDTQSGWYQIEYEEGKKGWVSGQYIVAN